MGAEELTLTHIDPFSLADKENPLRRQLEELWRYSFGVLAEEMSPNPLCLPENPITPGPANDVLTARRGYEVVGAATTGVRVVGEHDIGIIHTFQKQLVEHGSSPLPDGTTILFPRTVFAGYPDKGIGSALIENLDDTFQPEFWALVTRSPKMVQVLCRTLGTQTEITVGGLPPHSEQGPPSLMSELFLQAMSEWNECHELPSGAVAFVLPGIVNTPIGEEQTPGRLRNIFAELRGFQEQLDIDATDNPVSGKKYATLPVTAVNGYRLGLGEITKSDASASEQNQASPNVSLCS